MKSRPRERRSRCHPDPRRAAWLDRRDRPARPATRFSAGCAGEPSFWRSPPCRWRRAASAVRRHHRTTRRRWTASATFQPSWRCRDDGGGRRRDSHATSEAPPTTASRGRAHHDDDHDRRARPPTPVPSAGSPTATTSCHRRLHPRRHGRGYSGLMCCELVSRGWAVEVDAETGQPIDFGLEVLEPWAGRVGRRRDPARHELQRRSGGLRRRAASRSSTSSSRSRSCCSPSPSSRNGRRGQLRHPLGALVREYDTRPRVRGVGPSAPADDSGCRGDGFHHTTRKVARCWTRSPRRRPLRARASSPTPDGRHDADPPRPTGACPRRDARRRTQEACSYAPRPTTAATRNTDGAPCQPGPVLQAQGLSVEVGGRFVVESASFTVMPRDKVGLVGRNGAGKTSLFKVLGGEVEPTAGRVLRKGGFGYLPQDPRIAGVLDGRTAVTHVLSGPRHRRGVRAHREAAHRHGGRPERAQRRPLQPRRGACSAPTAATRPRARRGRIAAGLGLGADRLDLPIGVLSGGERRRVELARILFAGSDVLLPRRADQPPRRRRQGVAARVPAQVPRRAARHQPRPRPARRGDHPRAAPRPPDEDAVGHLVEYKGTYTQYRAAAGRRRGAADARRCPQTKEIARLQTLRRPLRRQGHQGRDGAQHGEADRPPRGRQGRRAARRPRRCACASRRRRRPGLTVIEATGCARPTAGPPVFEDVSFDLGRGERLLVLGLNGAGKTSLLRILAGETDADLGDVRVRPPGHTSATTRRSTTTCASTSRCSTTSAARCRRASMLTETQLRGLLGMMGLSGEKVFQDAGTLSGGEKTKLALAMLMVGRNNLLLLDEPTNNLDPPQPPVGRRRARRLDGRASSSSATTPSSSSNWRRRRCC